MAIGDYAVGDWTFNGCDCPIVAAGVKERDWAIELAEMFDERARDELEVGNNDETVSEEDAKTVWKSVIGELEGMIQNSETESERDRHKAMLELAQEVKKELGWD